MPVFSLKHASIDSASALEAEADSIEGMRGAFHRREAIPDRVWSDGGGPKGH
jgi:hypothetical protein